MTRSDMSRVPSLAPRRAGPTSTRRQRGAALLFALVVLVILMASGVAVVRSMNASLTGAGNLAFRRDLINQAEQAVAKVVEAEFPKGADATGAAIKALNYSPSPLPANSHGIPEALLSDTKFALVGNTANDLTGMTSDVEIRYVVERLCKDGTQTAEAQGASGCVRPQSGPSGGTAHLGQSGGGGGLSEQIQPIYRVSVRVTGPRNTRVFLQSTFTKPEE